MNHPYNGTASYIYASEHPSPSTDDDDGSHFKNPYYDNLPSPSSSIPSPGPSNSRRSHDSAWSTEGTYTARIQRSTHEASSSRARGNSLTQPLLIPLRGPIAHPYQQHTAVSEVEEVMRYVNPPPRSTSLPRTRHRNGGGAQRSMMTPYASYGDPLSLRKSAFVPQDHSVSGTKEELRESRVPSWRKRIERPRFRVRRLSIEGLKRLLCF
ncbi:hypothetical protein C8R46DRAFT_1062650 [Mycena filopes]|nr:hypothetical protein C8R46DRAFT_1062650 [Mycena filopes]